MRGPANCPGSYIEQMVFFETPFLILPADNLLKSLQVHPGGVV
jgi:hypothetical protein